MSDNFTKSAWKLKQTETNWEEGSGLIGVIAKHSHEILSSIEDHAFTLSILLILTWYIIISATWNMKNCEEFWRYLWFLGILWIVVAIKNCFFDSKESTKK